MCFFFEEMQNPPIPTTDGVLWLQQQGMSAGNVSAWVNMFDTTVAATQSDSVAQPVSDGISIYFSSGKSLQVTLPAINGTTPMIYAVLKSRDAAWSSYSAIIEQDGGALLSYFQPSTTEFATAQQRLVYNGNNIANQQVIPEIDNWMILGFSPHNNPSGNQFVIGEWIYFASPNYDLKALIIYSAYDATTDGIVTNYLGKKYHIALIPAPGAPVATAGDNSATLNWNAVSGASSYNVYRDGTLLASGITEAMRATGWVDTTAINGNTYSYTITAIDSTTGGETAQSASTTVTVE